MFLHQMTHSLKCWFCHILEKSSFSNLPRFLSFYISFNSDHNTAIECWINNNDYRSVFRRRFQKAVKRNKTYLIFLLNLAFTTGTKMIHISKSRYPLTPGNAWVRSQHCGYWCPCAKALNKCKPNKCNLFQIYTIREYGQVSDTEVR